MASTPWPERSSESSPGPRVAGVDPGTVSIDVCALDGGEVRFERSFRSADLALDPAPLIDALAAARPFDLVLGPAGYGLPLVPGERVGERELALMVLLRRDEAGADTGIGGMRALIRALIAAGLPLVFGPGAIHLPTVPEYRKWNRVDLGTADKVCSAALCIVDQAGRLARAPCLLDALTERLAGVAPVRAATGLGARAKTAAQGAAVLADGLAGGRYAPLVERLGLREASGTVLDHLRMH